MLTSESLAASEQWWRSILDLGWRLPDTSAQSPGYLQGILQNIERWRGLYGATSVIDELPRLTYAATGGVQDHIQAVIAAWIAIRSALKLFDDVEDGATPTRPGEHINLALGLLFAAQASLDELPAVGLSADVTHQLRQSLNHAILRACAGQQNDLVLSRSVPLQADSDTWLRVAGAKSGAPLAWAAWAGGCVAGANNMALVACHQYGYHLGILLQLADDLTDTWYPEGSSDIASGSLSLSICYALHVSTGPERDHLAALLTRARQGDTEAEAEALDLLTHLGAQAYLLTVAQLHYQQVIAAVQTLCDTESSHRDLIEVAHRIFPALQARWSEDIPAKSQVGAIAQNLVGWRETDP